MKRINIAARTGVAALALAVAILTAGLWLVGDTQPVAAQNDPTSIVERLYDRVNEGDVDRALAVLDDNVVMRVGPCQAAFGPEGCVGKEQFRPVLEELVDRGLQFTILSLESSGSTVVARVEVREGLFTTLGIERGIFFDTWEVVSGAIMSVLEVPDLSDAETARLIEILSAPQPPSTGNAGLADSKGGSGSWPWWLLAAGAAAAFTLSARLLAARR